MSFDLSALINILITLGGVVAAAIYVKSTLFKQSTRELETLAATRGQRVDDLEQQIHRLNERIAKLEGSYEALQRLKVDEIANAVVAKLVGESPDEPMELF